jgi:hypothetical protein
MTRVRIPDDVAAEALYSHRRTCCVCNISNRRIQIHHIDEDPSNNAIENLAVLCFEDHDLTQITGGFGRKLGASEVRKHRDEWVARVARAREEAHAIIVAQMAAAPPEPDLSPENWHPPSNEALVRLLDSLPATRELTHRQAHLKWDTGYHNEMMDGTFFAIDVFTRVWLELAKWYAPGQFDGRMPEDYFSEWVARRHVWNRALGEPDGLGSAGRDAILIAAGDTMDDIEEAIVEMARWLYLHRLLERYDFEAWEARWREATREVDAT